MIVSKKNLKFLAIGVLVLVAYKMYSKKPSPLAKADVPNKPYTPSAEECKKKHMEWKKFSMTGSFASGEAKEEKKRNMLGACYDSYGQRR